MKPIATHFHTESPSLTIDIGFDGVGVSVALMVDACKLELLFLLIPCVVADFAVAGDVTFIVSELEVMVGVAVLFIRKGEGDVEQGFCVG